MTGIIAANNDDQFVACQGCIRGYSIFKNIINY